MRMEEIESDILNDLAELSDPISRYTYLLSCAEDCDPLPEKYRQDEYLIPECQVHTWAAMEWRNGISCFRADSESMIVRGALALLQEIYKDRSTAEVHAYRCHLLENKLFADHFTAEQRKGLNTILVQLSKEG